MAALPLDRGLACLLLAIKGAGPLAPSSTVVQPTAGMAATWDFASVWGLGDKGNYCRPDALLFFCAV